MYAIRSYYEVKIKLNNTSHELMPGMVCKVGVHSHETEAGIVLPNHTVQLQPDGKKFVITSYSIHYTKLYDIGIAYQSRNPMASFEQFIQ